jgi:hypothetical protein
LELAFSENGKTRLSLLVAVVICYVSGVLWIKVFQE